MLYNSETKILSAKKVADLSLSSRAPRREQAKQKAHGEAERIC